MSWTPEREKKLKELWKKGHTASQIAKIIGDTTRNAVIGKAHRLDLEARSTSKKSKPIAKLITEGEKGASEKPEKMGRKARFKSLLLDKNFEPAKNLSLEELTEDTCKYMEGHPDNPSSSFCGRKTVEKFSYCPLHLMIIYQPKNKKEDLVDKEDGVPHFIEKKIKSA